MPDQDFKILITTEADNSGFASAGAAAKGLDAEMGVINVTEKDVKKALAGTEEGFGGAALKGREFHEVCAKLNQVVPGLGTAMKGLAAASEGLILTMGPLIIAVLAIDMAMEKWKQHQEEIKEQQEELNAKLDMQRDLLDQARQEQTKYREEMEKASKPQNEFAESLGNATAVLEARQKAQRKLLQEAGAGEAELSVFDSEAEKQKIALKANARVALHADLFQLEGQRDQLEGQRAGADKIGNKVYAEELGKKIDALDARIFSERSQLTKYSGDVVTETNVAGINEQGRQVANILNAKDSQTGMAMKDILTAAHASASEQIDYAKALQQNHISLQQAFAALKQQVHAMQFNNK